MRSVSYAAVFESFEHFATLRETVIGNYIKLNNSTIAFSNEKKCFKGNPVRSGSCPATVKGTKARKTVNSKQ